jgi:hypothetical protein
LPISLSLVAFARVPMLIRQLVILLMSPLIAGCAVDLVYPGTGTRPPASPPDHQVHPLTIEQAWPIELIDDRPFDASGLLWWGEQLLTVNDKGATLYRVRFASDGTRCHLQPWPELFTRAELDQFAAEKVGRYDCEGIALAPDGRLFVCEEANRWVLGCDLSTGKVERVPIDWKPVADYLDPRDLNASWEGIAIGNNRLYLANERKTGRIVVVDWATRKVVDHFQVRPAGRPFPDIHYSDLCWFEDSLWVLCRESQTVVRVNPETKQILSEFSYRAVENDPEYRFKTPFTGTMEGLAVTATHIWLATDNNGQGRVHHPKDTRPVLFKCRRPDVVVETGN